MVIEVEPALPQVPAKDTTSQSPPMGEPNTAPARVAPTTPGTAAEVPSVVPQKPEGMGSLQTPARDASVMVPVAAPIAAPVTTADKVVRRPVNARGGRTPTEAPPVTGARGVQPLVPRGQPKALAQNITVEAAPAPASKGLQDAVTTPAVRMPKTARTAAAAPSGVIAGAAGTWPALMDTVGRIASEATPSLGDGVAIPSSSGVATRPAIEAAETAITTKGRMARGPSAAPVAGGIAPVGTALPPVEPVVAPTKPARASPVPASKALGGAVDRGRGI